MIDDNKIGYANPPKDTQFKKGKSGNPKGRPPKNREEDAISVLEAEAGKMMSVRINGKSKRLSTQQVIIMRLAEKARAGDTNAGIKFLQLIIKNRRSELDKMAGGIFKTAIKLGL